MLVFFFMCFCFLEFCGGVRVFSRGCVGFGSVGWVWFFVGFVFRDEVDNVEGGSCFLVFKSFWGFSSIGEV